MFVWGSYSEVGAGDRTAAEPVAAAGVAESSGVGVSSKIGSAVRDGSAVGAGGRGVVEASSGDGPGPPQAASNSAPRAKTISQPNCSRITLSAAPQDQPRHSREHLGICPGGRKSRHHGNFRGDLCGRIPGAGAVPGGGQSSGAALRPAVPMTRFERKMPSHTRRRTVEESTSPADLH